MQLPDAKYISQDTKHLFSLDGIQKQDLTSDGKTTGPSPYLIESTNGTYDDRDKPAPLNLDSEMGVLRGYVTRLQDDINVYLTERIKSSEHGVVEEQDDEEEEDDEEEDEEDGEE